MYDHLIRVADTIDTLRDMLSSTMDAYLSVSGNRMNKIMKRLTSISTILMSVTLIAGIYGMNFDRMPELKWRYGYVFACCDGGSGIVALRVSEESRLAMKKDLSRLIRHRTSKKGDTAQLAAQLAPLEELDKTAEQQQGDAITSFHSPVAHQEAGAIIVEADSLSHERDRRRKHEAMLGLSRW